MWERRNSRWRLSNPTSGITASPSLSSPKNTFPSGFVGDSNITIPFTVAFVSGEEMSQGESSRSGVTLDFLLLPGDNDGDSYDRLEAMDDR